MVSPINNRPLLLLVLLTVSISAISQVTPFTNLYQQNWQMVNPAAIDRWQIFQRANNSSMLFSTNYRGQWLLGGVEGAPNTFYASFENAPFVNESASGIKYGVTAFYDKAGVFQNTGASANFSYYFDFSKKEVIHLGLSAGMVQYGINRGDIRAANESDNLLSGLDGSKWLPDFSLGVFYRRKLSPWGDRMYAGFSIPKVFNRAGNKTAILDKGTPFYLLAGAFLVSDGGSGFAGDITYEPSIWVRHAKGLGFYSVSTQKWQYLSVDASLRVYFNDKFWFGAGYGTYQSGMAEAGFLLEPEESEKRIRLGLSYSFPAGSKYLNLGHSLEVMASMGIE
ncbi:MAG: PorP/SprF family type IX secretion system membrane protein [Saprospiraceae bacterium]|nr:PorP/SprF family type IX secretion system membrane protein [Saprospiraceae bacterium]